MEKQFLSIGDKVLMKDGRTLTVKSLEYHDFVSKEEIGYIPKKDIERNLTPLKAQTTKAVGVDAPVRQGVVQPVQTAGHNIDMNKHFGYLLVKIVRHSSPKAWYRDLVGHTVIVGPSNKFDYTLKLDEGSNRLRWIPKTDCEIIGVAE